MLRTDNSGHSGTNDKGGKIVTEEQSSQRRQGGTTSGSGVGGSAGSANPLQSDRGSTTISDSVVQKIAGIAAQEVEGVRMGGGSTQTVSNLLGSITGGSAGGGSASQGVSVEVGQEEAALDLTCTVAYGNIIPSLTDAVRKNIVSRVESLVGLRVTEVNITVSNVYFPQQEHQQQIEEQRQEQEAQEQQRVQ
ncbi:hypothetical protein BH18ACT11_BH18ACT11_23180 [soil metagenome]